MLIRHKAKFLGLLLLVQTLTAAEIYVENKPAAVQRENQKETPREIQGILLEGGEYSGKTSVSKELENALVQKGLKVVKGHAVLYRSPMIMMLNKEAFRSLPKHIPIAFPDKEFFRRFNGFRTAQLMADMMLAKDRMDAWGHKDTWVIQDRHWYSQKFMNHFFTPGQFEEEERWIESHKPEFKYKFYLACSNKVRLQRSKRWPKFGAFASLDRYFLYHIRKMEVFDRFCIDLIAKEAGWVVIDTSDKTPLEIANIILEKIGLA